MSLISDIIKFAILQVAVICSILLILDIVALTNAIVLNGLDLSRALKIMTTSRGHELIGLAICYALFSSAFQQTFDTLHILAKETISLFPIFTVGALYQIFYKTPVFYYTPTGNQTADYAISCT